MLLSIGFMLGALITAPVFFLIGRFSRLDSRVTHEPADITLALRRSSR